MRSIFQRAIAVCAAASATLTAGAAEFKFGEQTLKVPDGFVVEKVAATPLVDRPIVADFDEEGHLYVADSSGSNDPVKKQLEDKPHRIVRLTDRDGDGVFDSSTVFAGGMMFPEGAMWLEGSLYVSAPPSIWKLTDTDGDGVADRREEWFDAKTLTGCANDLHGPYLGLDGWIYWCKGAFAEQTYPRPDGKPFVTRAAHIFRRRASGGFIEPVMTGGMDNPVDVTFTAEGERIFTTTFLQHPGGGQRDGLIHAIYGGVYGKEHDVIDGHKRTGELMPVLAHLGPAAPAGLTRYESRAFGAEYQNNLFACNFNLQRVTRHVLEPDGATFRAGTAPFISSDHHDFHPTDVIEDADGSLLVIDTGGWYKICCPTSQLWKPDVLGAIYRIRRQDAPKISDPRGLNIAWDTEAAARLGDPRPAVARRAVQTLRRAGAVEPLAAALRGGEVAARRNAVWALAGIGSDAARQALVQALRDESDSVKQAALHALSVNLHTGISGAVTPLLKCGNGQVRRAAAELLGRLGEKSAVPAIFAALGELQPAGNSVLPGRVLEHSLIYALIEIGAPDETRAGLGSPNSFVRRAALIALDQMDDGRLDPKQVAPLLTGKDRVLSQTANWIVSHRPGWGGELASALGQRLLGGELSPADEAELQGQLAQFAGHAAIQELLAKAVLDRSLADGPRKVALRAMRQGRPKEFPAAWDRALAQAMSEPALAAEATESAIALFGRDRSAEFARALRQNAAQSLLPLELRLRAIGAISAGQSLAGHDFDSLLAALGSNQPLAVTTVAAGVLSRAKLTGAQQLALAEQARLVGPIELNTLLTAFEPHPNEALGERLLASLRDARGVAGLQLDRARQLFAKYPPKVQEEAARLFSLLDEDASKQAARLEQLLPSLKEGDIRRGQAIFNSERAACSACHAIGYLGGHLGPDLTKVGQVRTERDLLESIVYPSASFVRSFEPVIVTTRDGEEYSGLVRHETAEELLLATGPNLEVRIARANIAGMRPGRLSVMPQGLDEQLSRQELADLLAFLKATRS